jgi:hypothetical protein
MPYVRLELKVDDTIVHLYMHPFQGKVALHEAQVRGEPLGGPYSAQYHRAHTTPGEDHIHVYRKNNQLFALSRGGTAHDRSHGVKIPNKVADGIRLKFPEIRIPPNNYIESACLEDEANLLLESSGES